MEEITTVDQMSVLIHSGEALLLFKYSPTCGISQVAQEAWEAFSCGSGRSLRLAQCDVVGSRPAARGMVEMVGVAHQSPQILAIKGGKCIGHASHYSITLELLQGMQQKLS